MNKKVSQIVEKIKLKYHNINTILLFGSAVADEWTPDSDIDIFLIDNSLNDSRTDEIIDDVEVEIQKDNFANLTKDISSERGQLLNRNISTMIASSKTISTNSPTELQNLHSLALSVLESATTCTDEDINMWRYSIKDYLAKATKDIKRDDPVAFYLDAHYVIQNAIELSLAIHGAYLPQPKNLAKLLQKIDPELLKVLHNYSSSTDLNSRLQALTPLEHLNH